MPRERPPFLAIFEDLEQERDPRIPRWAQSSLLAEIDAFVARLSSGAYFADWGWDDDLHDERAFGDESWVEEMDELFASASDVFLDGDMQLAREALGRLLKAFDLDEEGATFCGSESPEATVSTDVGEAKLRCLRAV